MAGDAVREQAASLRPRRNRVTPFGELVLGPRGAALMGNRGDLHDKDGRIIRKRKSGNRRWIACSLSNDTGWRVPFDKPGHYTPLFFADEATAFAAGHRPCSQCRKSEYKLFQNCWRAAFRSPTAPSADDMDVALEATRIDAHGNQITRSMPLADLPDGVFLTLPEDANAPVLKWGEALFPWSLTGYSAPKTAQKTCLVTVLTPAPIIEVFRHGYRPATAISPELCS